jgi:hypothetical protein
MSHFVLACAEDCIIASFFTRAALTGNPEFEQPESVWVCAHTTHDETAQCGHSAHKKM